MNFKDIAFLSAQVADDKKAINIRILDVKKLTPITNYFVILSGSSLTQTRAIYEAIDKKLKEMKVAPLRVEGGRESHWILLDYGGVIVHVFYDTTRRFYDLDHLWNRAKELTFHPVAND